MQRLVLLLALIPAALSAAPVRPALETTIRGSNGTEASFRIVGIWADGYHFQPSPIRPATFVAWDKVDLEWLEANRPEIAKLKAAAEPFPSISAEDAQAKIAAARKTFVASKTVRTSSGESPNTMAEAYARKLRGITPANITQTLAQIVEDRKKDLARLKDSDGVESSYYSWLRSDELLACLHAFEKAQSAIDPLNAGVIELPKLRRKPQIPDDPPSWF